MTSVVRVLLSITRCPMKFVKAASCAVPVKPRPSKVVLNVVQIGRAHV